MLNLYELEQFVSLEENKTLSKVAQQFHISTPSITRSMQNLEEEFGVCLFERSKNKIVLNETGKIALEQSKKLLQEVSQTINTVREYDLKRKTITITSCAPAPVWKLLPKLNEKYPNMTIASNICQNEEVLDALKNSICDIAILPYPIKDKNYTSQEFMKENLFVNVPKDHALATHKELSFQDINGFNFLLRTQLGFWDTLCRNKMPASKFLVQNDEFEFRELVKSSSLPCFSTDYSLENHESFPNRINIPLTDEEAKVTFYVIHKK